MKHFFHKHPRALFWGLIALSVIICWTVRFLFQKNGVWNSGVAFNLTISTNIIYTIIAVLLGGLTGWFMRQTNPSVNIIWGISLVVGGGLANLADRLIHDGAVWDYIPFGTFGHFNLADILVTAGLLILLYNWWKQDAKHTLNPQLFLKTIICSYRTSQPD